jgi:GNAT superfamily N-acetyltransferase
MSTTEQNSRIETAWAACSVDGGSEFRELCKIALSARLYVSSSGWELYHELKWYSECETKNQGLGVGVFFLEERPVGCFLGRVQKDKTYASVDIFVKKEFRRKGFGFKMIERFKEEARFRTLLPSTGINGSEKFFESVKADFHFFEDNGKDEFREEQQAAQA